LNRQGAKTPRNKQTEAYLASSCETITLKNIDFTFSKQVSDLQEIEPV
jgi:hypothetical protein